MTSATPVVLPSSFGRLFLGASVLGAFAIAGGVGALLHHEVDMFSGGIWVIASVVVVARAWVLRRRPALIADQDGLYEGDGSLLLTWDRAALVWVRAWPSARSLARVRLLAVQVWEAPALDYAQRTGLPVVAVVALPAVPTSLSARRVVDMLRELTDTPVLTGSTKELERHLHPDRHRR